MAKEKDCIKLFGHPESAEVYRWMTLYRVEREIKEFIPCLPDKIYLNKLILKPLEKSLKDIILHGLSEEIKTFDGCYNVRKIRGNDKVWSSHSWGISVDFNEKENGLGKQPKMNPHVVEIFKRHGFEWGGDFPRVDGMHFELKELK